MTNATLDHLTSHEKRAEYERDEQRARRDGFILRVILVLLLVAYIVGTIRNITRSYVRITNVEAVGASALCPGDTLIYRYEYSAKGEGAAVTDATVWRVDPPQTVVFSNWRRFVLVGERQERVTERWAVPKTYVDLATGEAMPIPPGNYERQFSISSDNDDEVGDTGVVTFSVREDCEE